MPLDSVASIETLRHICDHAEQRLASATETFRLAGIALEELNDRTKAHGVPVKDSAEYHANIRIIDAFDAACEARWNAELSLRDASDAVHVAECSLVGIEVRR